MQYRSKIYKALLILSASLVILYLFPRGGQFKFEFSKGKVWQYPDYYAPFDFSIQKSQAEINEDQEAVLNSVSPYLRIDLSVKDSVQVRYAKAFENTMSLPEDQSQRDSLFEFGDLLLQRIYRYGVLSPSYPHQGNDLVFLIQDRTETQVLIDSLFRPESLFDFIATRVNQAGYAPYLESFQDVFFELITPNISLDQVFTDSAFQEAIQGISLSRGGVSAGELIIAKGNRVDEERFEKLQSLRSEYALQQSDQQSLWIVFGYSILIMLTFSLLFMFLYNYRLSIYENNKELTFIFLNILIVIAATTVVLNYNTTYVLAVPICILPLLIKTFFDARLGLFTHVLTVLLLGFVVPNSFEFVFLQIVAGIVTLQSVTQLHRRAQLFLSVGRIVGVYLIAYIAFTTVQEGSLFKVDFIPILLFLLNGLLMLFVQPLIYIYEKSFQLVSDVSLLELTDTHSVLLKRLSDEAPGTFHHSIQVANLAEAAASEIGANTLLVRVGALYHDIGKLSAPNYFSENQTGSYSPHDALSPRESVQIILTHISDGVALAQKNNLPQRIIDFIQTHHGTSLVYYFYKKALEENKEAVVENDFRYSGPKPFSKEMAILMMADAVEAGSKSLKNPNSSEIESFVNTIIEDKKEAKQFNDSHITLAEIETVKRILFQKLINVYQLRVEYPK